MIVPEVCVRYCIVCIYLETVYVIQMFKNLTDAVYLREDTMVPVPGLN